MPVKQLDITPTTDRVKSTVSQTIELGTLESVTVHVVAGNPRRGDTYIQTGIYTGGTQPEHVSVILASGYVGAGFTQGWTGQLHLEASDVLFIHAWSAVAVDLRLSARVNRG